MNCAVFPIHDDDVHSRLPTHGECLKCAIECNNMSNSPKSAPQFTCNARNEFAEFCDSFEILLASWWTNGMLELQQLYTNQLINKSWKQIRVNPSAKVCRMQLILSNRTAETHCPDANCSSHPHTHYAVPCSHQRSSETIKPEYDLLTAHIWKPACPV